MSLHDAWGRLTPYEIGIPGRLWWERAYERIREEVAGRSVDASDPGAFALLGQVGLAIREIQGPERGGEALQRYGAFLFQAYHFRRAGEPLFLLEAEAARELVAGGAAPEAGVPATSRGATPASAPAAGQRAAPDEGPAEPPLWDGSPPTDAGYLQLPRHLFWSEADRNAPAEPIDGFFWTRSAKDTLALLAALGVRADRPGISVMELPAVPLADARASVGRTVRESGRDFESSLPGGELARLHSIETVGEALKLVGRTFERLATDPAALGPVERSPRPGGGSLDAPVDPAQPRPSLLPFRRIRARGAA